MKISYNWLKDYIVNLPDPENLSLLLTDCGLEVESYEDFCSVQGGLKGIVVGEVISKEKHPDADKLSLCTVSTGGDGLFKVVCGAPNVEMGQKVLFAPVGTKVFKGSESFILSKAKIRGVESHGMICAEDEIGIGNSHEGIMVLPDDAKVGMPAADYFNVYQDVVFEIGLTPNRADAASHIGVARDIIAVLNFRSFEENKSFNISENKVQTPDISSFTVADNDFNIDVEIKHPDCIRYSGLTITGVKVSESPDWLKNKLLAIGVRPINNIVDITNYVLFETGQPLHAFDAAKVKGRKVVIEKLKDKTSFVCLDNVIRELSSEDLMICNAEEPMCIAGVFGGVESGITEHSDSVFLESACFSPSSVRRTSKRHGLKTDASFRFERGTDPDMTVFALKRAAIMICDIAGGKVSSEVKDVYPVPVKPAEVELSLDRLQMLAGDKIEKEFVVVILESLQIKIQHDAGDVLSLIIPSFKNEVTREADVVEEILRIYGYNRIPLTGRINASLSHNVESASEKRKNIVSSLLTANGFYEIICNSLTSQSWYEGNDYFPMSRCVKILNPLSRDLNMMRQTLLFGGLETILYNQNRKMPDLKLFEFGNVYFAGENTGSEDDVTVKYSQKSMLSLFLTGQKVSENWYIPMQKVDFFYLKAFVYNLLKRLGINTSKLAASEIINDLIYHEGLSLASANKKLASFGQIKMEIIKKAGIKDNVFYAEFDWEVILEMSSDKTLKVKELPRFPEVKRDLALVLNKNIKYADLQKIAVKTASPLLKSMSLFDIYEGDKLGNELKSYAVRFVLEDKEKTLTDDIIDNTMNKLIKAFETNFGAKLR